MTTLERPICTFCDNEALYACTQYDWDYTELGMGELTWEEPYCMPCAIECGFSLIRDDVSIIDPQDSWWKYHQRRSDRLN